MLSSLMHPALNQIVYGYDSGTIMKEEKKENWNRGTH